MYSENELKYVVVVNRTCPLWKTFNIVAHLSNALARQMRARNDLAFVSYQGASGTLYGEFPVHPYIVLQANSGEKLRNVATSVREAGLAIVSIIDPMIGNSTEEQVQAASETEEDKAEYVGIAFYGDSNIINPITKKLSALRIDVTLNEIIEMVKADEARKSAMLFQPTEGEGVR